MDIQGGAGSGSILRAGAFGDAKRAVLGSERAKSPWPTGCSTGLSYYSASGKDTSTIHNLIMLIFKEEELVIRAH
jgi:hypothetical protein